MIDGTPRLLQLIDFIIAEELRNAADYALI